MLTRDSAFTAAMLEVLYGIEIDAGDRDGYAGAVAAALEGISEAMVPGRFLVEFLPWLKDAPAWVPGSGRQELFRRTREAGRVLLTKPFAFMKRHMVGGDCEGGGCPLLEGE